jgi:hypothetical protein
MQTAAFLLIGFALSDVSGSSSNARVASISAHSTISYVRREAPQDTPSNQLKVFNEMTPQDVLCRLKNDLASDTAAAWMHASMINTMIKYNISNSFGMQDDGRDFTLWPFSGSSKVCAVVSNSGVLQTHEHGQDIDNADVVFRFNDAPLEKWEKNVGTKRSIRLVSGMFPGYVVHHSTMAAFGIDNDELVAIISGGTIPELDSFRSQYPQAPVQIIDTALLQRFETSLKSIYDADWFQQGGMARPTTGAIGMLSAMQRCDEVRAYGMARSSNGDRAPYHYYDDHRIPQDQKANHNGQHEDFEAEKDLWRRIATNGAIDLDATDVAVIPGFSQVTC